MLDDGLLCLFNCWFVGGLDFVVVVGCRGRGRGRGRDALIRCRIGVGVGVVVG